MNDITVPTSLPVIDFTKYDDKQLEDLINEANRELKKRHDKDVRQFKADIRKKAKAMGLNVSFDDLEPKTKQGN